MWQHGNVAARPQRLGLVVNNNERVGTVRAYRVKTVITEDHQVTATLPEDAPPGEAELLVLVNDISETDDSKDLAAYRRAIREYEKSGQKSVPFDQILREMGL